jgi:integrase
VVTTAYTNKGASIVDLTLLSTLVTPETFDRYESAWQKFLSIGIANQWLVPLSDHILFQLENYPLWKFSAWLVEMSNHHPLHEVRNAYSGLLLIPGVEQLRFEGTLRPLKRKWSQTRPKYDAFYEVDTLIQILMEGPMPTSEEGVRRQLILLLRLLCLFRGVDLARAKNNLVIKQGLWYIPMIRKGRKSYANYPVPSIEPFRVNPRFWLQKYILMTAGRGTHLFWTLPGKGPMKPLASGTINAITTRFLHANGLSDFTAHSTRGAAATTLLARGVPPPPSGSTTGGLGFGAILSFVLQSAHQTRPLVHTHDPQRTKVLCKLPCPQYGAFSG